MRKQERGTVLTSVILMVLVLTLIGVPLLSMVVFNYQLREMDNSLRRSEYETEIIMDQIYLIIRNTVVAAIEDAKTKATKSVDDVSKAQVDAYKDLVPQYDALWDSVMIEKGINDQNYGEEIDNVLGDETAKQFLKLTNADSITLDNIKDASTVQEGKDFYLYNQVQEELKYVSSDVTLRELIEYNGNSGSLIDLSTGMVDESALRNSYNSVFGYYYDKFILDNVNAQIENFDYRSLVAIEIDDEHYMINSENPNYGDGAYLQIKSDVAPSAEYSCIDIPVSINFRKSSKVFPAGLSATFLIWAPRFDEVTSVDQYSVPLSNPMTSRGMVVGGTMKLDENTIFNAESDITIMTYNESGDEGEDVEDGIVLNAGSMFNAESGVAVNGDIRLNGGCNFTSGSKELYYQNLYVGDIDEPDESEVYKITFGGNVVAKDDLEINTEGEVTVTQPNGLNYYGYNDTNDRGPDSSSSIVVNSKRVDNKTLQFGNLYLAGRAFIADTIKVVEPSDREYVADKDGEYILNDGKYVFAVPEDRVGKETFKIKDIVYKTGESIAVKGNYIAYQTPLSGEYGPDKVKFSRYFMERNGSGDKQYATINLADEFINGGDFDLEKHKYFEKYAETFSSTIKKIKVDANIKYMIGTGFDKNRNLVPQTDNVDDDTFIVNWGNKYDKYTQYFGYAIPEEGETAKTRIFGTDGWLDLSKMRNNSDPIEVKKDDETIEEYQLIYDKTSQNKSLELEENSKGIIIVKGNLEIKVTDDVEFAGMIVVGGDLTITGGGTLTVKDGQDDVVNMIIGSYLADEENEGDDLATEIAGTLGGAVADAVGNELFNIFNYDDSETSYIITKVADNSFIDANELIDIANWKKNDSGRL